MANQTGNNDLNRSSNGNFPGLNASPVFALDEGLLTHSQGLDDPSGNSFNNQQYWPLNTGDFELQYPLSLVDRDDFHRELDQLLQSHPDYRPPNQNRDLFHASAAAPLAITFPVEVGNLHDINLRSFPIPEYRKPRPNYAVHQNFPPAPHDPREDFIAEAAVSLSLRKVFDTSGPQEVDVPLEWQSAASDGLFGAPQGGIPLSQGLSSHQYSIGFARHVGHDVSHVSVPTSTFKSQRCFECCFSHKPCTVSVSGFPCDRCTLLHRKMHANPRHTQQLNSHSSLFLDFVVFFDLRSTQTLLTRLRGAAEVMTNLQPGLSLEDYFKGCIVCHMDNRISPNFTFSTTGVPVVVRHLATTQAALAIADSKKQAFPLPGLDDIQMDSFIDVSNRMSSLQELDRNEQAIIITALRCSDYIGILFNWDLNAVCFENIGSLPQAKNLVLETAYSMAYRVQQLLMILCHEVNHSLVGDYYQDPATIACALRIVYQSIDRSKRLQWNAGNLQDLKKFLNGLHERAPAALKALDRYRVNVAFLRCGQTSHHVKAFQALIDAKKMPKSAISFTYQRHHEDERFLIPPNEYSQQIYTEVLETRMVNLSTFQFESQLESFSPEFFDYIELQTLENEKSLPSRDPCMETTLAELLRQDRQLTTKSYAASVNSEPDETGSVVEQDNTTPILTLNKTDSGKSKTSLGARKLAQASKALSRTKGSIPLLTVSATPSQLEKRRRDENLSPTSELPSSLLAPQSPNSKRPCTDQPPRDPVILTLGDQKADEFDLPAWDCVFNFELYETMN